MNQEVITSSNNLAIKHLKKLLDSAKYRREQGVAVAESIHLARSLLHAGIDAEQVICAESALGNQEVAQLLAQFKLQKRQVLVAKDSLFESISQIHAAVGIMVIFQPVVPTLQHNLNTNALLLEDVQDPGNMGTILRTAAAAGVKKVYLSAGSASVYSPKVMRAGMGAQFNLEIYENTDLAELIAKAEILILATDLDSKSSLYQTDLSVNVAWLFGSEGRGVSENLLAACSASVNIPQADDTVESLNVAAAVAICLFEQRRQSLFKRA